MMRLTWWPGFLLVALLFGGLGCSAAQADGKPVKPVKEWKGNFPTKEEEALLSEAPASGYIADAKAWAKLWKAWRGKEELPKVDFEKQLVLVRTALGAKNKIEGDCSLDDKGDLKGNFSATEIGGPGFVYLIVVVDRAGIKTYNGKAIEKK